MSTVHRACLPARVISGLQDAGVMSASFLPSARPSGRLSSSSGSVVCVCVCVTQALLHGRGGLVKVLGRPADQ